MFWIRFLCLSVSIFAKKSFRFPTNSVDISKDLVIRLMNAFKASDSKDYGDSIKKRLSELEL